MGFIGFMGLLGFFAMWILLDFGFVQPIGETAATATLIGPDKPLGERLGLDLQERCNRVLRLELCFLLLAVQDSLDRLEVGDDGGHCSYASGSIAQR